MSASNPFATRFTHPDRADYLFAEPDGAARLLTRWDHVGGRAAIVGPHGVGKSTLLATLGRTLADRGESVVSWSLRAGQRTPPPEAWRQAVSRRPTPANSERPSPGPILLLDGYEQLSWWSRRTVRRDLTRCGWRCLLTAHRGTAFPTLTSLRPDVERAVAVVERLLTAGAVPSATVSPGDIPPPGDSTMDRLTQPPCAHAADTRLVTETDVRQAFAQRRGDLRETLFDLYDLWERRSARAVGVPSVPG